MNQTIADGQQYTSSGLIHGVSVITKPQDNGTSPVVWIQWQGRLYGPYQNDAGASKDGFRFDGGAPLKDPYEHTDWKP